MSGGRCRSAGNEDGSSGGKEGGAVQKTGLPTLQTTELEEQDKMPGEGGGGHLGYNITRYVSYIGVTKAKSLT